MSKFKFAMYWAGSCGGCEIALLEIQAKIIEVDQNYDVVFWPAAADFKYKDLEAYERALAGRIRDGLLHAPRRHE